MKKMCNPNNKNLVVFQFVKWVMFALNKNFLVVKISRKMCTTQNGPKVISK